ncbi:uncharacterized protein LOC142238683 [Haematobia irritans]|uniref:uncharacterized protein LOC142238683 n=1 Tax=Haematobia irritans TaxID=7368 RepID=UPI003F4F6EE0
MMDRKRALELDKICRVCICERKDMRPLFSEKIAEMIMECASVTVEPTEGWPDKICVQCVHAVSRCHAFKMQVERSDKELREYIKSITVRVVIDEKPQIESPMRVNQTTRVVLDEIQGLKLQQSQAKLIELQQQQQLLLQQQQEQQLLKLQQQRQQKSIQKQIKQQELRQQQQQQQQSIKRKSPLKKLQPSTKKSTTHQAQTLQQTPQQTQQILLPQPTLNLSETVSLQTRLPNPQSLLNPPQLMPISSNSSNVTNNNANATTTTSLPSQLVLPNGQIITTTQILTTNGNGGPPQLAQIISSPNPPTNPVAQPQPPQAQFTPQLIQTTGGQTLQLIQTPNGLVQLVQILPQRTSGHGMNNNTHAAILEQDQLTMIDEDSIMEQSEQHLIEDDEEEQDARNLDDQSTGNHLQHHHSARDQICETIVVEDEQIQIHHQHHQLLQQNVELEYLDDVTVKTSQQHTGGELILPDGTVVQDVMDDEEEELEENEDDIIEEIPMEEEMLDEDGTAVLLESSNGSEFLTEQDVDDHHQILHSDEYNEDNSLTHYTVVEGCISADGADVDDVDALEEAEVANIFQAACDANENDRLQQNMNNNQMQTTVTNSSNVMNSNANFSPSISKKARRTNTSSSRSIANTRQLQATANSIAQAAQDDDIEIDSKLIDDFINQQTTVLGSGRYKCNLCQREFKQFKGLQNHMHLHSNWIRANCKKQPQCEICQKKFKGPGMLRMHMKTHQSASKVPTCHICQKTFKSKAILYRHRQTHQQRSYCCAIDNCRKHFSTALTLKLHVERKHPNTSNIPKYKCGECNHIFYDIEGLEEHLQITGHGGEPLAAQTMVSNNHMTHAQTTIQNLNMTNVQNNSSLPTVTMTEMVSGNGDVYIVTQA